jgi:hypothetical protein
MMFDGSEIKIGDLVHDIVFGSGQVDALMEGENRIRVDFGGSHRVYNVNGQGHFPQKTLFWRDPIGNFVPPKGGARWALFEEMRKAVSVVCKTTNNVRED